MTVCPICNPNFNDMCITHVECSACGQYEIDPGPLMSLKNDRDIISQKHILSGITREANEDNRKPIKITDNNIKELIESANIPDGPIEQIDRILLYIYKKSGINPVHIKKSHDYPIAFAKDPTEFLNLLNVAINAGYLEHHVSHNEVSKYQLNIKSLNRLREIRRLRPDSNQVFIAMSFSEELRSAYVNGIKPAVEETGYKSIRMDYIEHNEKIDDKIIAEIRKSNLLIADLTENNAGAYFEAGIAIGLGIQVIWTCRENHFGEIHFDANHYAFILWKDSEELKNKLIARIEATMPLLDK